MKKIEQNSKNFGKKVRCNRTDCRLYVNGGCTYCPSCGADPYHLSSKCANCQSGCKQRLSFSSPVQNVNTAKQKLELIKSKHLISNDNVAHSEQFIDNTSITAVSNIVSDIETSLSMIVEEIECLQESIDEVKELVGIDE